MSLTVADHIAAFLRDRQVDLAFGLCGHTNISLLAALERGGGPRFITTRHEQVAAHAADGYARASGKPGVVILHVGPGLTNATTGVATAALDSVPLVVIAGDVPTYYENRGPHQELNLLRDADQTSVFAPFVKRTWRLGRADQVPRVLARAWDLAQAGRPGPVLVSVPMDLLTEALDAPIIPASPLQKTALDPQLAEEIARQLRTGGATVHPRRWRDAQGHGGLDSPRRGRAGPRWSHADGGGSPPSRPSPTAGHGRLLGQSGSQQAGVHRRPHPCRGDQVPRDRLEQLGTRNDICHPAHTPHPDRHRSE